MTTTHAPTKPATTPYGGDEGSYLTQGGRGFRSWFFTLDHKRIGVMYLTGILIAFVVAGFFAMLIRTEHWDNTPTVLTANQYNKTFTLHGVMMVFMVIIPGVPAALGNVVLPIMLGAKDVAFPRINLFSFYLWLTGAVLASVVIFSSGGGDTGWTFYTPYSSSATTKNVVPLAAGAFVLGFSSVFTGLNFITTIHKMRAPGMGWWQMPLLLWAIYATGVMQILATPVIGITLVLLIIESTTGVGIFRPDLGGDPVLFQHFFWFYSHPAVYIMIVPALGVVSELFTTFCHKRIYGYKFIALSSVAIALLSFLVWGHHMFTSGQSGLLNTIFSAITFTIAVPTAIKLFNWLGTFYKGSITLETPMLFALSFMFIFLIGGLTGLFLSTLATDLHLHDTYFVVAHFHYVMAGTIFAFFGGLFYWWPKICGRMYHENLGRLASILFFVGFNVNFLPQFVMGSQGMPRRYWTYLEQYQPYHQASTVGAYIMAAGVIVMAVTLTLSLLRGRKAPPNPWGGATLEWFTASPPPLTNFKEMPTVHDIYDYSGLVYDGPEKGYRWDDKVAAERRAEVAAQGYEHY